MQWPMEIGIGGFTPTGSEKVKDGGETEFSDFLPSGEQKKPVVSSFTVEHKTLH